MKSPSECTPDLIRVGRIALGRVPWSQVALPRQTNVQCHYGSSCCSRPRGWPCGARTPRLHGLESERGSQRLGLPGGLPWRRRLVWPSRTSRLPSGTASTEPGRPLAFHYRAYESSSPGKYVAIKINRPALSAEHNANYLWAVCAIFIIVQAPGASCLLAYPARPGPLRAKLRPDCGGQRPLGTRREFRGRGRASACFTGRGHHFGFQHSFHICWRPTTCEIRGRWGEKKTKTKTLEKLEPKRQARAGGAIQAEASWLPD